MTHIRISVNFQISSDVLVLQLRVNISQKQLTFLRPRWCNGLWSQKQIKQSDIINSEIQIRQ